MPLTSRRFLQNARIKGASESRPSLRQGESGEAVLIVQQALVDLGSVLPKSTRNGTRAPDGIFGPETVHAVREFQHANGLVVDGIVGRDTLAELDRQIIAMG